MTTYLPVPIGDPDGQSGIASFHEGTWKIDVSTVYIHMNYASGGGMSGRAVETHAF